MKPSTPVPAGILRHPVHCLSLGFGVGAIPFAPGTFGTVLAVPLYLVLQGLPLWAYLAAVALVFVAGVLASERTARVLGQHDHPAIVIDEVAGFLIAMVAAPAGLGWVLAGFLLFRLFDIWKPWPIRLADRHVHGGLGIMLDDALAGVYAFLVLQTIVWLFSIP